jgi:tetratricopeptide (TPR) repeat protein
MLRLLPKLVRRCLGVATWTFASLARAGREARRRPGTTVLVLVLLVAAALGASYFYALREWRLAQEAVKAGRLDEAKRSLNLCLVVWPRSIPVHLLAARAARLRGDFVRAEVHLNHCLKLQHGATEAIQLEFLLMRVQGGEEDEVASILLSQYVENNSPDSSLILETLARAYMYNLRYGPAFVCLSRWIEVAPDSAEPLRWRGWILERLNDYNGAEEDYKRALEFDPGLVPVRLRLAEMYLERSDALKALPHLEQLRQQFPNRPDILARTGQCRLLQGDSQEARRLLEAAVERLPNDSATLIHLAKLEMQDNHPEKAETWLRRALKVDPTDTEAEFLLVGSFQAQNRLEDASAMLEQHDKDTASLKRVSRVLQQEAGKPSNDPDAFADIGILFLRSNERVGLYWLHRALEHDSGHPAAHRALADFYEGKGDRERAAFHRYKVKPEKNESPKKETQKTVAYP